MRVLQVGAVLLIGCGRLGFEPPVLADDVPTDDARSGDDGTPLPDGAVAPDGALPPDAAVTACSSTTAVPVVVGARMAARTTCVTDLLDGCGPAGTQEVVFAFTPPTTRGYNVRAYDPGTNNITTSVGVVNAGCTATTGCSGLLGTTFTAGVVVYFAFEGPSGGCKSIELLVD